MKRWDTATEVVGYIILLSFLCFAAGCTSQPDNKPGFSFKAAIPVTGDLVYEAR